MQLCLRPISSSPPDTLHQCPLLSCNQPVTTFPTAYLESPSFRTTSAATVRQASTSPWPLSLPSDWRRCRSVIAPMIRSHVNGHMTNHVTDHVTGHVTVPLWIRNTENVLTSCDNGPFVCILRVVCYVLCLFSDVCVQQFTIKLIFSICNLLDAYFLYHNYYYIHMHIIS